MLFQHLTLNRPQPLGGLGAEAVTGPTGWTLPGHYLQEEQGAFIEKIN